MIQPHYKGREDGVVPKQLSLDRRAAELLEDVLAPTPKNQGSCVSALIFAEVARREERQRLKALLFPEDETTTEPVEAA